MRPFNVKLLCCIGLFGFAIILGCGSGGDLLDEPGQRYTANIAIKDPKDETLSVDVIQDYCEADWEDYYPASAAVEFAVDANAPGITLTGYTLEYIPLESEDGTGTIVMPPTLDSPLRGGNLGIDIASGGSASFDITCMSVDTKEEYRRKVGYLYYYETAGGLAVIADKQAEVDAKQDDIDAKKLQITNKEVEINNKRDEILAAALAGDDTTGLELQLSRLEDQLSYLEDQLSDLEAQLTDLEAELSVLPRQLWSIPELEEGRYKIRITFEFEDTSGEERTVVREATVWLGNFDNC